MRKVKEVREVMVVMVEEVEVREVMVVMMEEVRRGGRGWWRR